jgi:VWFA-related protein
LLSAVKNPVALACLLASAAWPQNGTAFRSNVELVTIPCTVVDAGGVKVRDLAREEFRIYDNGVRRIVEHLWTDADEPLTLGVILDASESQRDQLDEHRQTALELLERILRPGDRAFVVAVDEDVRLWADLTGSAAGVRRQMEFGRGSSFGQPCGRRASNAPGVAPASVCGGTPLWNAVYEAGRKMRPLTGDKALLILTDGFDTGSTHSVKEAAEEVEWAGTVVYAIQYQSRLGGKYAPDLYALAGETGGTWFSPPRGDYEAIPARMESDLRSHYVVGFRPENLSAGKVRHDVTIEVNRPGLTVRARKTYFRAPR